MSITKPPVLPAWADSGDKVQPTNSELQVGWPVSSIPPSRQRFNWILNYVANGIRYFSRRGIPDYDAAETYMTGDRIIGDDGKTYRSLIDTNLAQTPSTSPTKWERWALTLAEMYTSLVTPAQFDNSVKPATTEFVRRTGMQTNGIRSLSANTTLTALDVGSTIYLGGAGGFTITLPLAATLPAGTRIEVVSGVSATISRQGAEPIYSANVTGSEVATISIGAGDTLTFIASPGTGWFVFGSSQLGYTASFGKSLASSGYQKLPGGLILQWGNDGSPALSSSVTFPIAFPTAVYQIVATLYATSTGGNASVVTPGPTTSGFNITKSAAISCNWIALGK
jgi:hypothetical protein